jgi:hypothetical protein
METNMIGWIIFYLAIAAFCFGIWFPSGEKKDDLSVLTVTIIAAALWPLTIIAAFGMWLGGQIDKRKKQ